jgi:pimeloyl-ACP methyl ester carboxylesterase
MITSHDVRREDAMLGDEYEQPSRAEAFVSQSVSLEGMEMYFEVLGRGEPLLLLHGFNGCGADWTHVFPVWPEGWRLVVPDLRGHGRSTNPSRQFTFRQAALDVLALLDHLGLRRVKAIGMSAGAKTLLHLATRQVERLEAMVLVSAAPYFPKEARALMAQIETEGRTDADWRFMRERHRHGDEQIKDLWRQGRAFMDSYDDMNFTPPYLSTIRARTLIVHGDRDPIYPLHIPFEMHAAIPGSYLCIVPNGGHGPIFGKQRASFEEAALAFLRGEWKA